MSEKNKKRIVTSLAALFVMLAMISLCLLGSTMARYTSGGSASASVDIAKWNVSVTNNGSPYTGSTKVTFDKLSPKYNQNSTYSSTEVNYTSLVTVATITLGYDTDVDVSLSLGYDTLSYLDSNGSAVSFADSSVQYTNDSGTLTGSGASQTQVEGVLKLNIFYSTAGDWSLTSGNLSSTSNGSKIDLTSTGATISFAGKETEATSSNINYDSSQSSNNYRSTSDTVIYVYAYVSWTSAYSTTTGNNALVNAIDTWIGTNIAKVTTNVTCEAVQASQLPSA